MTKYGNAPFAIGDLTVTGPFAQKQSGSGEAGCSTGTVLEPGAQCSLALAFAPTQPGQVAGSLTIAPGDQAQGAASLTVALEGTSTASPQSSPPPQQVSLIWPTPTPIPGGTPLGAAQLNASAPVAGVFAYVPGTGTILPSGPQTLTVQFTPADAAAYAPATAQVSLIVLPAVAAVLSPSTPSLAIGPGQTSGSLSLSVGTPAGFTGTVQFSCAGLPASANCVFAPSILTVNADASAPAGTQLMIGLGSTPAVAGLRGPMDRELPSPFPATIFLLPGGFLSASFCAVRRVANCDRVLLPLLFLAAIGLGCGMSGCGLTSNQPSSPAASSAVPSAATSTYTVTITASGTGNLPFSETATIVLHVAQ